jgi:hypothetical protein
MSSDWAVCWSMTIQLVPSRARDPACTVVRLSREQLEELGAAFQALVAGYARPADEDPTGPTTALINLRLYTFPARPPQPGNEAP